MWIVHFCLAYVEQKNSNLLKVVQVLPRNINIHRVFCWFSCCTECRRAADVCECTDGMAQPAQGLLDCYSQTTHHCVEYLAPRVIDRVAR